LAIGTIQPIILKKYANDFSKIGSEYGILSSVWSFGSILGVFLTGFFFISTIGSTETIWTISIILFLIGSVFAIGNKKILSIYAIVAILVVLFIFTTSNKILDLGNLSKTIYQNETNYYKAKVVDANIPGFGQSRILFLDFDSHSIQPEKTNEYFYPEMYPVFSNIKKNIKDILVIGAGAYTMPKYFKDYYKNSNVSVIEMDPKMVDIGNNYFDLKKYDINTLVGDARVIISKDPKKYDVIFGDAYNSFISVPWYLLTKEWNSNVKERLNDGGVYAINFIGSLIGSGSEFTKSVLNTFKISFQNYYMFSFGLTPESTQNIVLVGIKGDLPLSEKDLYQKLLKGNMSFLARRMVPIEFFTNSTSMVLTDNFSPVEKLMMPTVEKYFPNNLEFNKLFQ
jgi:spermidine synthase